MCHTLVIALPIESQVVVKAQEQPHYKICSCNAHVHACAVFSFAVLQRSSSGTMKENSGREDCLQFMMGLGCIKARLASICSGLDDADRRVIVLSVIDI